MSTPEGQGERVNRELIELLNELRVALPGAQVLLAFLLTVPFMQRFEELDAWDRRIYMFAVLSVAVACLLLIAPSAHHRMRFRQGAKLDIIRTANACALAGLLLLAVGVGASVYLVANVVYGDTFAAVAGGALVAVTLLLWFGLPLRFGRDGEQPAWRGPAGRGALRGRGPRRSTRQLRPKTGSSAIELRPGSPAWPSSGVTPSISCTPFSVE